MLTGKGRASGKFILLGEHFVVPVEGQPAVPALAFPMPNLFCEVKIAANHHPHYKVDIPGIADRATVESLMARATYAAASSMSFDVSQQPLNVSSSANFAVSRGFGSSAAFAVALVRALDELRKKLTGQAASWDDLARATVAVEKIFHGRPSGLDTAVVLAGRAIRFEAGAVVREVANRAVDFVVVDSGSRDDCATLVTEVVAFRERNPSQWTKLAEALRRLVDETETALGAGDAATVARAVRASHGILSELGLANDDISRLLHESERLGALAGKVSGAGGGGAVVLVTARGEGTGLAQRLRERNWDVVGIEPAEGTK